MLAAPLSSDEGVRPMLTTTAVSTRPARRFLIRLDMALDSVASASAPEVLIDLRNTAEALRIYASRSKLGLVAQNKAAVVRLWAERRIGEFLIETERHAGGRPLKKPVPDGNGFSPARLRELGIDRKLSSRAQRLAAMPVAEFKTWLDQAQERQIEICTRDLLNLIDRREAARRNRQRIVGGQVADLVAFARAGNRVGTVYLDPAWPSDGTVLPYESIDLNELRNLPIPALAAERCHIHMWATGINCQFLAKEIIEFWGFRIVGDFVWVKPALGGRNYWRQSHESLLTAVRANMDDRFDDHGLRSWIEAPRGRHSEKPEVVRALIERASPGPRLELFARRLTRGWFAWGHEVAEPLTVQHVS
jgi:N6-adenosine-specific RNA methylase IME4